MGNGNEQEAYPTGTPMSGDDPRGKDGASSAPDALEKNEEGMGNRLFPEDYVRELREENRARRLENVELKAEIERLKSEFSDFMVELCEGAGIEKIDDRVRVKERIVEELTIVREALVYTAFSSEARAVGLADKVIPDAYKLADLADVSIDPKTRTVLGVGEAVGRLVAEKPYLFAARPHDVGGEANPPFGATAYPAEIETLARELGVSVQFAAELSKRRAERIGENKGILDLWRRPNVGRLSLFKG